VASSRPNPAGEDAKGKPTLVRLDKAAPSPDWLRRWYRAIRVRDFQGAPSAPMAGQRFKECADGLEWFAEQVYQAREWP
jgi:hypothetical protein